MALPVDPDLALGTLRVLARSQGRAVDPVTEEEPGRIVHELRPGADPELALGGGVYYGTADATPLFVVVLAELARWGADPADVADLLPHADRALEWVERYGDRDGDGFVEYQRTSDRGLLNQGWKDSPDGVPFADGRLPEGPIALCEVQGYVHAAYRARADLARWAGDEATARRCEERAGALRAAFDERFWLPDRGWYALALDGAKRPVDALTSNPGHCLWSGIVAEDRAPLVAERLLAPELFSGWGVRTLASSMGAYDPVSYHDGSVWPHDCALVAAGLARYGFAEEARRVAVAVLEAAERFGGRLPELFCGFDRAEFGEPVPYPTSCSPQAWASAAPVQLLRTLTGFDPVLPEGRVSVAPALPGEWLPLRVSGLRLGSSLVDVEVSADGVVVHGLPAGVRVDVREPG
jgi:glycogen debranching enzyme